MILTCGDSSGSACPSDPDITFRPAATNPYLKVIPQERGFTARTGATVGSGDKKGEGSVSVSSGSRAVTLCSGSGCGGGSGGVASGREAARVPSGDPRAGSAAPSVAGGGAAAPFSLVAPASSSNGATRKQVQPTNISKTPTGICTATMKRTVGGQVQL